MAYPQRALRLYCPATNKTASALDQLKRAYGRLSPHDRLAIHTHRAPALARAVVAQV